MISLAAPRATRKFSTRELHLLQARFQKQGYLILQDFVPPEWISRWQRVAFDLLIEEAARPVQYVHNESFRVLPLKPEREFLNDQFLNAEGLVQICQTLLATSDYYLPIMDIALNLPGRKNQHVHRDFATILPQMKQALPTTALCLAIPLVETNETNGAVEIWPHSHHWIDDRLKFQDDLKSRTKGKKSLRPCLDLGTLMIRDSRLVHRGRAHQSPTPRPWLSWMAIHPLIHLNSKLSVTKKTWMQLSPQSQRQLRFSK